MVRLLMDEHTSEHLTTEMERYGPRFVSFDSTQNHLDSSLYTTATLSTAASRSGHLGDSTKGLQLWNEYEG
jgi:hypothetical protein